MTVSAKICDRATVEALKKEVQDFLYTAKNLDHEKAWVLFSVSNWHTNRSAILSQIRKIGKNETSLGITRIREIVKSLEKEGLLLISVKKDDRDKILITTIGAQVLAQIEVNFPEKVYSVFELKNLCLLPDKEPRISSSYIMSSQQKGGFVASMLVS